MNIIPGSEQNAPENCTFMQEITVMDIALKYRIVETITHSQDETLLEEVASLLGLLDKDFWDDLPVEVRQATSTSKEQLDRGEGISHDPNGPIALYVPVKERHQ